MSEWISIEDRLPEHCIEVLIYPRAISKTGMYHRDRGWVDPWIMDKLTVTHWMQLPEPPEVEDESEA